MHRRTMRLRRSVLVVAVTCIIGGCSDRVPTSTVMPAPQPRRIASGEALGSGEVNIPPHNLTCTTGVYGNTDCNGGIPWTRYWLNQALPAGQWAAVRVSGRIHLTENPALAPYYCPPDPRWTLRCLRGFPLSGASIGPFGVKENPNADTQQRAFAVFVRIGQETLFRRSLAPDSSAFVAFMWGRYDSYEILRTGIGTRWCIGTENCRTPIPAYLLSGNQTVEVVAVDPPATVVATSSASGDTIHFEARSTFGFGGISWHFQAGDTAAAPEWKNHEFVDRYTWWYPDVFSDSVRGCTGRPTCAFVPPESGRMYLKAQLMEGSEPIAMTAVFASDVVGRPPADPKMSVQCVGADQHRGSEVDCQISVSPAVAFTITRRLANSRSITNDDRTPVTVPAGEVYHWKGTRVESTRVTVEGTTIATAGQPVQLRASARFDADRRGWQIYTIPSGSIDVKRDTVTISILNPDHPPPWGAMQLNPVLIDSVADIDSVATGPNAGAMYLRSQPSFPAGDMVVINIHPAMFPPAPTGVLKNPAWQVWYNDQDGKGGANLLPLFPQLWCRQQDMPKFVSETERHEGVTLATNSHVGVAMQALRDGRLDRRLEAWVSDAAVRTEALGRVFGVFLDWNNNVHLKAQGVFEGPDTIATLSNIGCQTDNDLTPP